MDCIALRLKIFKILEETLIDRNPLDDPEMIELRETIEGRPTIDKIKKAIIALDGNKLYVFYLMINGVRKGKDIAKTIGISEAMVSKIRRCEEFQRIRAYLLFASEINIDMPRDPVRDRAGNLCLTPEERNLRAAQVSDILYGDFSDEDDIDDPDVLRKKQRGFVSNLRDWTRRVPENVGNTNYKYGESAKTQGKRSEAQQVDELSRYWEELKKRPKNPGNWLING